MTQQAQEGVAPDPQAQAMAQACPGRARQLHGDVHQPVREAAASAEPRERRAMTAAR